jgi:hypothetical protein
VLDELVFDFFTLSCSEELSGREFDPLGIDSLDSVGFGIGTLLSLFDGNLAACEAEELSDFDPYAGTPNLFLAGSPFLINQYNRSSQPKGIIAIIAHQPE